MKEIEKKKEKVSTHTKKNKNKNKTFPGLSGSGDPQTLKFNDLINRWMDQPMDQHTNK